MKVTIKDLTELTLNHIPGMCSHCLYWSDPEEFERTRSEISERKQELTTKKTRWIVQTLKEFGSCGSVLYCNNVPVGYAEYGPSDRFSRIKEYRSQPIGSSEERVIFLSCLYIVDGNLRRRGLGGKLLDNACANVQQRGFRAIETFARTDSAENPSGPVELYLKKGFRVKNDNDPEFPIVRLEF